MLRELNCTRAPCNRLGLRRRVRLFIGVGPPDKVSELRPHAGAGPTRPETAVQAFIPWTWKHAEAKRHARRRAANNRYRLTPVFYLRAEGCWTFNGTAPAAGPGMIARIHETISHVLRSKYLVVMTLSATVRNSFDILFFFVCSVSY